MNLPNIICMFDNSFANCPKLKISVKEEKADAAVLAKHEAVAKNKLIVETKKNEGVDWNKILSYTIENEEVTITRLKDKTLTHVTIPSTINGYPVKYIERHAFKDCANLVNINLSDKINVSPSAFEGCTKL